MKDSNSMILDNNKNNPSSITKNVLKKKQLDIKNLDKILSLDFDLEKEAEYFSSLERERQYMLSIYLKPYSIYGIFGSSESIIYYEYFKAITIALSGIEKCRDSTEFALRRHFHFNQELINHYIIAKQDPKLFKYLIPTYSNL